MDPPNPNIASELDALPIPPFDDDFFLNNPVLPENQVPDLGFDFDITFDDFYFPSESEDFLIPDGSRPQDGSVGSVDQNSNFPSPESGSSNSDAATISDLQLPRSFQGHTECSGQVSSQGSGNCGSGVSHAMNSPSRDSISCDQDGSGSIPSSPNFPIDSTVFVADKKVKVEEFGKVSSTKRKKENEHENIESRSSKFRRSILDNANIQHGLSPANEEDEKRKARLMRNRESAQLSRQRKKHYVEELEDKIRSMHSTITELNSKISVIMAENASLRQQLSTGGMCQPPPGLYPHPPVAPMAYPWVPYAPYVVKPQGSQVPLVPIPRLKPQLPVSASKAKKSETKKAEVKTKKVASVSFLGLLFFILLFGGLVPLVNVRFGNIGDTVPSHSFSSRFYNQSRGRVLMGDSRMNGSDWMIGMGFANGIDVANRRLGEKGCSGGPEGSLEQDKWRSQYLGNASEPLVASLYVPRNDKLVQIDGNLIIHSVLASEKAMASFGKNDKGKVIETGLAVKGDLVPALVLSEGMNDGRSSHLYRHQTERQKALSSSPTDGFKDNLKSTVADGKVQQWFREGLAGPMLSSGMCTEVFHFDVSPASAKGAIIPAKSVANISSEELHHSTQLNKGKNRRTLHGLPIPFSGSTINITENHVGNNSNTQKEDIRPNNNKPPSSMVVSVLVDPREAGDNSEVDGRIGSKSLSRIFVVVLLDSVKYVTYSCMLPFKVTSPHLVTT